MGEVAHLELILILDDLSSAIVDSHGPFRQTVFLFELSVQQKYRFTRFRWALLESLLKQIARSLQFRATLRKTQNRCDTMCVRKDSRIA
jgi:hypothetical protein